MKTSEMPVIELSGNPRQRGRIYGKSAKAAIAEVVHLWRAGLGDGSGKAGSLSSAEADKYIEAFLSETEYLSAIEQWTPDLLEEVKGIAEGAEQTFNNILGLQLMDEEWIYGIQRKLERPSSKCTAFAVPNQADGVSYAGQNMDVPSWIESRQTLLRLTKTDHSPEALIFSMAGSLGFNGLNANGLGITCNTLIQLNYATDGLPVAFIVRSVLEKNSIDEAEEFLRSIKHASGQNYILSSAGDMRCFECCSTRVVRYAPENWQGRVVHSNHPLANQDESDLIRPEKRRGPSSLARFGSISNRLCDVSTQLTLEDIKAALSAHDNPDYPRFLQYQSGSQCDGVYRRCVNL